VNQPIGNMAVAMSPLQFTFSKS